jgi:hypothetical protein
VLRKWWKLLLPEYDASSTSSIHVPLKHIAGAPTARRTLRELRQGNGSKKLLTNGNTD